MVRNNRQKGESSQRVQIIIAVIGLVGVLGGALLANWDKIFPRTHKARTAETEVPPSRTNVVTNPREICKELWGKSVSIIANNHRGVIGPFGTQWNEQANGIYHFETVASFSNEPTDPVNGNCQDGRIVFLRTRTGVFVQEYSGNIVKEQSGLKLQGSFTHGSSGRTDGRRYAWSGIVSN